MLGLSATALTRIVSNESGIVAFNCQIIIADPSTCNTQQQNAIFIIYADLKVFSFGQAMLDLHGPSGVCSIA